MIRNSTVNITWYFKRAGYNQAVNFPLLLFHDCCGDFEEDFFGAGG